METYVMDSFILPLTATLAGVSCALQLILLGLVFRFRDSYIIKSSSAFFSYIIIGAGLFLLCEGIADGGYVKSAMAATLCALLFVTPADSDLLCGARTWLTSLSLVLLLSPVFIKTYRCACAF